MKLFPSIGMYLLVLIIGVLIYLLFWLMGRVLPRLSQRPGFQDWVWRYLPILEASVWFGYAIWVVNRLFGENSLVGIVYLGLLLLIAWPFVTNWLIGLLVKAGDVFKPGQRIQFQAYQGMIHQMHALSVEIELDNRERLIIPYERLRKELIVKRSPTEKIRPHRFELRIASAHKPLEVMAELKQRVLLLPWTVPDRPPLVEHRGRHESAEKYEVVLYSVDEQYFPLMEESLRSAFEGTNDA